MNGCRLVMMKKWRRADHDAGDAPVRCSSRRRALSLTRRLPSASMARASSA
jgi:hypothetical protein